MAGIRRSAKKITGKVVGSKQEQGSYWKIGTAILQNQEKEGWGAKVIEQLAKDLRSLFPDMSGLSTRNLKYMRAFAVAYPHFAQQGSTQSIERKNGNEKENLQEIMQAALAVSNEKEIVQQPAAQLPWFHICTLLDKLKNPEERLYYMQQAVTNGWSRTILVHQIENKLYQRKGAAIPNFATTLPQPKSDLAQQMLKDPYKFDFLSLGDEYKEKDLEEALEKHITKFLLERGAGFSYAGRQYALELPGDTEDRRMDLLFYHLKLRCFVVVDLKVDSFKPEYAGKLNFYLNIVDDQLRHPADGPSIGLLICKERNKVIAEYALRGIDKPIGITTYELNAAIPENLKGSLPTIEEIEAELNDKD